MESPAGKHIESRLIVRGKERLFPKACHDLLPSWLSTHLGEGIVFCYDLVIYICELVYSVRRLTTEGKQRKPSTKVLLGRQSYLSQRYSGTRNRSPDYL